MTTNNNNGRITTAHNMLYLTIAGAVQVSGFLLRVIFRIGG